MTRDFLGTKGKGMGTTRRSRAAAKLGRFAAWPAFAGLFAATAGCTLLVDHSGEQCGSNSDCSKFVGTSCQASVCTPAACDKPADCQDFPGSICQDNQCVDASLGCQTNAECPGEFQICRKDTGSCVSLISEQCATVEGDYRNDDAFIFGSLAPTAGIDEKTGKALENSIKLAMSDIDVAANGLPPAPGGTGRRPMVLVGCNDGGEGAIGQVSARHLVEEVGVPAIIGAAFSGVTIDVATNVTKDGSVLLFSPSATSIDITNIDDDDLVWRTSPSDFYQARALSLYVPQVEEIAKADPDFDGPDVKLVILHKGDSYGSGLAKALEKQLTINGVSVLDAANAQNYKRLDYGDPDDAAHPTSYPSRIVEVLDFKPHLVLIFGTGEGVTKLLAPIENGWTTSNPNVAYLPRYVFSDGGEVTDLWTTVVAKKDGLRRRITGTVPGTDNNLFQAFRQAYLAQFGDQYSPDAFGTAGAYDITYLFAYGVTTLGNDPITGPNLAKAMSKMIKGDEVLVGDDINGVFTKLLAGRTIDFDGASGPLDFDVEKGEAVSDIQVWCMPDDAGSAGDGRHSGLFYNSRTDSLSGTIGPICDF